MIPTQNLLQVLQNIQASNVKVYTFRDILKTANPDDRYVVLYVQLDQNDLSKTISTKMHRPSCSHAPMVVNLIDSVSDSGYWLGFFEKSAVVNKTVSRCCVCNP